MSPFDVVWALLKEDEVSNYQNQLNNQLETVQRYLGMVEGDHNRPYAEFSAKELQSLIHGGGLPLDPKQLQAAREENQMRHMAAYPSAQLGVTGLRSEQVTGSQFPVGFSTDFQDKLASEPFDLAWAIVHQNRR